MANTTPDIAEPFSLGMWQIGFKLPDGATLYFFRSGGSQVPANPEREWGLHICEAGERRVDLECALAEQASHLLVPTTFARSQVYAVREKDLDALVRLAHVIFWQAHPNRVG